MTIGFVLSQICCITGGATTRASRGHRSNSSGRTPASVRATGGTQTDNFEEDLPRPSPMAWSPCGSYETANTNSVSSKNHAPKSGQAAIMEELDKKLHLHETQTTRRCTSNIEEQGHSVDVLGENFVFRASKTEGVDQKSLRTPRRTKTRQRRTVSSSGKSRGPITPQAAHQDDKNNIMEQNKLSSSHQNHSSPGGYDFVFGPAQQHGSSLPTPKRASRFLRSTRKTRRDIRPSSAASAGQRAFSTMNHDPIPVGEHARQTHRLGSEEAVSHEEAKAEAAAVKRAERLHAAGNAAFQKQQYDKAIDLYGEAKNVLVSASAQHERFVAILLSNRAAALLALSRPLQALEDCKEGMRRNPSFAKCGLRMATCHLRLGNLVEARAIVKDMLSKPFLGAKDVEHGRKKLEEIEEMHRETYRVLLGLLGQRVIQNLEDLFVGDQNGSSRQEKVFKRSEQESKVRDVSPEEAVRRLESLRCQMPHAEFLFAAYARALFHMGRFKDALSTANMKVHSDSSNIVATVGMLTPAWRPWFVAECNFYLGQSDKCLHGLKELVQLLERAGASDENEKERRQSSAQKILTVVMPVPSIEKVKSILSMVEKTERLRECGNTAVRSGRYEEAVASYSEALSLGTLSPSLAAILYCNRAAAHQGLRNVALSIADCGFAIGLAPDYGKAYSRLSGILCDIGMLTPAAESLSKALKLQGLASDVRQQYQKRLREIEYIKKMHYDCSRWSDARSDMLIIDHYQMLGLQRHCTTAEVKKSYRRLIMLHPDKTAATCRIADFMHCGCCTKDRQAHKECCDDEAMSSLSTKTLIVDALGRVKEEATWLFKCLGEARDVLLDDGKRSVLDSQLDALLSRRSTINTSSSAYERRHEKKGTSRYQHSWYNRRGGPSRYGYY